MYLKRSSCDIFTTPPAPALQEHLAFTTLPSVWERWTIDSVWLLFHGRAHKALHQKEFGVGLHSWFDTKRFDIILFKSHFLVAMGASRTIIGHCLRIFHQMLSWINAYSRAWSQSNHFHAGWCQHFLRHYCSDKRFPHQMNLLVSSSVASPTI
jgi:hypothetical protein